MLLAVTFNKIQLQTFICLICCCVAASCLWWPAVNLFFTREHQIRREMLLFQYLKYRVSSIAEMW